MGAGASSCTGKECVTCTTATADVVIKSVEDAVEDVVETARDMAHDARTTLLGTYRPPNEEVEPPTPEPLWFVPSAGWPGLVFEDVERVQSECGGTQRRI